jgi:hypothetical protein
VSEFEPKVRLAVLDPAADDPGYWLRFRRGVAERAGPVMAERRRRTSHLTLEGVVFAWGRWVLPAVAAAVLAAFLLTGDAPTERGGNVAGVEELLEGPSGAERLPSFLHSGEDFDREMVLLAVEIR